jgi:protein-L-isoaspartate(D-aspartate) O-methyltransferase
MSTAFDPDRRREAMVTHQVAARGITDARVLDALRAVPRERFVPEALAEFAYDDTPLEIEEGQTISQPYIVARMIAALHPQPRDRVLEVGTGSGYAAAVLAHAVGEVYTIERHAALADVARDRLRDLGYRTVHVRHGDGTLGWPEHAPYDGIVVAAGGPRVPQPLLDQLAIGGRLVIPVGEGRGGQRLLRVTRRDHDTYDEEELEPVRFVPLIGAEGWEGVGAVGRAGGTPRGRHALVRLVRECAEPLGDLEPESLAPLLDRIGNARVVLLGECTHGSAEFYRFRDRLTRELVRKKGFTIVALEADWPDAAQLDRWVRHRSPAADSPRAFDRFPPWMWRNGEVVECTDWLRAWNADRPDPATQTRVVGLDLYSLHTSIAAVLRYLDDVDPEAAAVARHRYGCLTPWEREPAMYGHAALTGRYRSCESPVVEMLRDLLERRVDYATRDGERFLDAAQNARLVANAEKYYRVMYYGGAAGWNQRDRHMFDTLAALLEADGPDARAVVWAHNSHIGNAAATEMAARGEFNLGQLCRERFGREAFLLGLGTHHGVVAAADDWDGPMRHKAVRPARDDSYESLLHASAHAACLLPLGASAHPDLRVELRTPRLERLIGVIYRPETERQSHYVEAVLPEQFDEYAWFDETRAVSPLPAALPHGHPFAD